MKRDEIIRMAREAELIPPEGYPGTGWLWVDGNLERFFQAAYAAGAAAEREACAKYVEECSLPDSYSEACLPEIANEIRARGQR